MRFQIIHTTHYLYEPGVFLEPHVFRLRPRCDSYQHLRHFSLTIKPEPAGITLSNDLDGNCTTLAWFSRLTEGLTVTARSTVDTHCQNPFDFIITTPELIRLPGEYPKAIEPMLAAYRTPAMPSESVAAFARGLAHECQSNTIEFLMLLARRIAETCKSITRDEGAPLSAEETLTKREGACRDLAMLHIDACRSVGLAARYVSGYHEADAGRHNDHMHAWSEVYLPGAGWRGFDPGSGLAAADRHVALAAGPDPDSATPVAGTFRGNGICSSMYAEVDIEMSPPEDALAPELV